ncbi:MAG: ABC transporter permease [Lachnospiraceae bacterium]|nr:ABC transporter permease [Lachnospiraceae bacterium]
MAKYMGKRFLFTILTLILVTIFLFLLTHVSGADPAKIMLGTNATPEAVEAMRAKLGLDRPWYVQYFSWISDLLHGDLGTSYYRDEKVSDLLVKYFKPTLALAIYSELIAIIIGVPMGIMQAKNKGKASSVIISTITLIGLSIPGFLLGLFLMFFFSVKIKIFPVSGYKAITEGFGEHIKSLVLPSLALGLSQAALITRTTNSAMLEVLNSEYIKTARAKGVNEKTILWKHALRNAMIPIITVCGQSFAVLFGGAVVIETIFNISGLGTLVYYSISNRDYSIIQGAVLVIALVYVVINLLVDVLYGIEDPRIRVGGKK